jgi:mono/diheme cytochrome c family protein
LLVLVVLLAAGGGLAAYALLFRQEPQRFDSPDDEFKYGSIGTEENDGVPYWVWLALPRVFPDLLPPTGTGGYTAFGFVWEEGRETPVGISKRTIGFPRVGINCALCHCGSYRTDPRAAPAAVPGAPATRLDLLAYQRFLFACASDPRFTADNLLAVIGYNTKLSPVEKLLYRYVLIPQTRKGLLAQKDQFAWTNSRPEWGAGRIDPFNPVKFHQLKMDPARDSSVGNSDMEPLWNRAGRAGHALHWDGLNSDPTEVVLSGAIGDGATASTVPYDRMMRLQRWLQHLPPPAYPYPVDDGLARKGQGVYDRHCAECHAVGAARTGKVVPVAEEKLKTDRHRLDMWSQEAADIYNRVPLRAPYGFHNFQKHDGYVAVPLDGLWLRGPYLHNGSVPTVDDLLEPPDRRPKVFFRGYDVVDRAKLGFVHAGPAAEADGWRYDVTVPGNGNQGHLYGTDLKADEKRALVEYLKTQ